MSAVLHMVTGHFASREYRHHEAIQDSVIPYVTLVLCYKQGRGGGDYVGGETPRWPGDRWKPFITQRFSLATL